MYNEKAKEFDFKIDANKGRKMRSIWSVLAEHSFDLCVGLIRFCMYSLFVGLLFIALTETVINLSGAAAISRTVHMSQQEALEQVLNPPDTSSIDYALRIGKYSDSE
nr:hypothetical protein [Achromobacter ruhlandii]